jgi:diketogulonate reductase-like aldo/keto reductase
MERVLQGREGEVAYVVPSPRLPATIAANGAAIPAVGLGTGRLRGDVATRAVHAALDSGYRHIDTAAKYGNEAEVGEAIRSHRLPRDEVFVTTKVLPAPAEDGRVEFAVEASLRRLGLERVDLLLIHWPSREIGLAEQVAALCRARRSGMASHIGVCNFPPRWLEAAAEIASEPIVVHQVERHPYFAQEVLAERGRRHGIATVAFCPLGRGALLEEPAVHAIAQTHGKTAAQVVMRWQLEQPMNAAVPSSSHPERIAANIDVFDFALSPAELAALARLERPDGRVVRGPPGYDWDAAPF